MTEPLPTLGLDDIRAAGPDRDNAEAFDPRETWCLACDKLGEGYPAADVAAVLLELASAEIDAVADYWRDHTLTTLDHPALNGRDFHCPDLRLCLALQDADPEREAWTCAPTLDPQSLWEAVQEVDGLLGERAALKAENAALKGALASALCYLGDDHTDDSDEARATREDIRAALAKTGTDY